MSEQVNIADRMDRISSLPDEVLRCILSLLPTKFAVSTCILSTRWRHLFPFSNNLDLDESLVFNPQIDDRIPNVRNNHFLNFLDRCIMLMNETHILKLRLKCLRAVDTSRLDSWICAAPLRNARELDLCISSVCEVKLSVGTCATLVVLKLSRLSSVMLNVPASVDLPSLKTLHLGSMRYWSEDTIEKLLSICPVLEELVMLQCFLRDLSLSSTSLKRLTVERCGVTYGRRLQLDAPSLVYLKYSIGARESYVLQNLHSLSEAHISIYGPSWLMDQVALPEFLEGISSVKSLYLSDYYAEHCLTRWERDGVPLCKNVTRLVFTCNSILHISVVVKLLKCCPNLEEFIFQQSIMEGCKDGFVDVPSCMSSRLKAIECELYCYALKDIRTSVELLEYFLKNSKVLEKMKIHLFCSGGLLSSYLEARGEFKKRVKTMKKLAKAPGRSKPCHFETFFSKDSS